MATSVLYMDSGATGDNDNVRVVSMTVHETVPEHCHVHGATNDAQDACTNIKALEVIAVYRQVDERGSMPREEDSVGETVKEQGPAAATIDGPTATKVPRASSKKTKETEKQAEVEQQQREEKVRHLDQRSLAAWPA
ncbi:hypothetical protein SPRG_01781 [Saprolegnia parasitica CBS 223.65]|uniref:Uncharacterized protein n=1 Tax=Saprolegnia parasitica (strain CBS 223.65) TaxID=695850 RepID=A0A067D599_SAPPC|nr:hypothetical protein SPRG_01781 [Saprolegnia parasitica CBS 223.65]KDO33901.1 hypothetical protein SPRG_01781 [Saprolegnia parasitica CBS 223.65]|eukprot:XP_012195537.1 hypothetical protein SPRG_01781 [Saprolegnia parasitica CBS 223.65]